MAKLAARLQSLRGKYYGAKVSIFLDDSRIGEIKIWTNAPPRSRLWYPSARDLAQNDYSSIDAAYSDCYPCDCHYESELDWQIAKAIEKVLNGLDLDQKTFD